MTAAMFEPLAEQATENQVCNGGIGMGALAVAGDERPEARSEVRAGEHHVQGDGDPEDPGHEVGLAHVPPGGP